MKRYYIVETTKRGRDWKKIGKGIDFLEDDKLYKLEFYAKDFVTFLRAKRAFKRNRPFIFTNYEES